MRVSLGTLSVSQTSGIFGFSMLRLNVSSVTTTPLRTRARAITKGSAPLRPLPTPMSRVL
jgi:hypothetical protein